MGREEQLREKQGDFDRILGEKRELRKELEEEKRDIDISEARKEAIDAEIIELQINEATMSAGSKFCGEFLGLHKSGDNEKLNRWLQENSNQKNYSLKAVGRFEENLPATEKSALNAAKKYKRNVEETHLLEEEYLKTYGSGKSDKEKERDEEETKLMFRGLQVAAFIVGLTSLTFAIIGRTNPPKRANNALASGNEGLSPTEAGGSSGTPDANLRSFDASHDGVSSSNVGAGTGDGTPSEPTAAELEKAMQDLVINKAVIASGKVPQDTLWNNLAADSSDLEAQNTALMFIQEASADLEGARDFFWLDISEATERYQALRAAHKRSGKLSDVYLEAKKIEYDGGKVPMSHVALLLQIALGLIQHDLLFSDAAAT
jgi:hypothetical protein